MTPDEGKNHFQRNYSNGFSQDPESQFDLSPVFNFGAQVKGRPFLGHQAPGISTKLISRSVLRSSSDTEIGAHTKNRILKNANTTELTKVVKSQSEGLEPRNLQNFVERKKFQQNFWRLDNLELRELNSSGLIMGPTWGDLLSAEFLAFLLFRILRPSHGTWEIFQKTSYGSI